MPYLSNGKNITLILVSQVYNYKNNGNYNILYLKKQGCNFLCIYLMQNLYLGICFNALFFRAYQMQNI